MNSYSSAYAYDDKASPGLWLAAISSYVIHVILGLASIGPSAGKHGAEQVGSVIGTAFGALIWPLIIVWIASRWESNSTQRRRVKVFFIASMVFVVLRLTAIFAIVGVRGYMASAKSAEARNTVDAIARGAIAAFEREQVGPDNTAVHRLCGSAKAVPGGVPRRAAHTPSTRKGTGWDTGDDAEGWRCLRFNGVARQYYQYSYTAGGPYKGPARGGPDPGDDGFEVAAEGDLDGEGVTSLLTRIGKMDAATGRVVLSTEIFVDKELE
jgi:hypothetical protein